MYWYYPLCVTVLMLILGLALLGGCSFLLPKAFRNQGWTAFCRKEYGVHALVIGLVYAAMGFCCRYFSFTLFETLLWTGILLIPTVSDLRMLHRKYKSLL